MVEQLTFNQSIGVRFPVSAPILSTGGWCNGCIRVSKTLGEGSIPSPPANLWYDGCESLAFKFVKLAERGQYSYRTPFSVNNGSDNTEELLAAARSKSFLR